MIIALTSPTPLWTAAARPAGSEHIRGPYSELRGELREAELEAQKKRLVDTFYKEVTQRYGLRPDSIDYDQFRIDDDGKTVYWKPGDKKIWISTTRGGVKFLALSTLATR